LALDQMRRASHKTRDALDATVRDVKNRTVGIVATTRGRLAHENVDDATVMERVRSKLGRACSNPRAIDVITVHGAVTVRGPILASEVNHFLDTIAAIRGVRSVTNELDPQASAEGVPSLQDQDSVAEPALAILQRN
jgi:hypothetical protein